MAKAGSKRIQKEKATVSKREDKAPVEAKKVDTSEVIDDMDALLDEIDGILEQNAEEFVKGYVQKGGE